MKKMFERGRCDMERALSSLKKIITEIFVKN